MICPVYILLLCSNNKRTLNGKQDCNSEEHQQWTFDVKSLQIKYLKDPNKCIDLAGANTANGNKVSVLLSRS
jgi:hypothetical protein